MKALLQQMFSRKTISELADDEEGHGPRLKRELGAWDVFAAGVAAIIGTGIFVLTGVAAANNAGPGIILSFILAGLVCGFVSFAYSELASMIPKSGSAYTYAFATLGEFVAWFIGWDLLLEYCIGSSAVAVGWSAYMQHILKDLGVWLTKADVMYQWGLFPNGVDLSLPAWLATAPAEMPWSNVVLALVCLGFGLMSILQSKQALVRVLGVGGMFFGAYHAVLAAMHITSIDILAVGIIAVINYWLVKGVRHTARMTSIFVVLKLAVILLFIGIGVSHVETSNFVPFLPFGWHGVLAGAGVVFFAFIGFDAVSTQAEECKNPSRDMPIGIIGSLVVSAVLYVAVAAVMTGIVPYNQLGIAAPMALVMERIGALWASPLVSLGAIAGITSVLIVCLFGQSRVMMSMSRDGLIAPVFSRISPTYGTPVVSILFWGAVAALTAGLIPINELAELTSIGTLAAFVVVCVGVILLRYKEPDRPRKFRCPGFPWVPALGAIFSIVLMLSLPWTTWLRFLGWMAIGIAIYLSYGRFNSVHHKLEAEKKNK